LLRAGQVARRWRYEVHHRRQHRSCDEDDSTVDTAKTAKLLSNHSSSSGNHQLWETVDASSFVQETYDKFLGLGKKLKLQQQLEVSGLSSFSLQQQGEIIRQPPLSSTESSTTRNLTANKKRSSKKKIINPAKWAQIQTGLALGNVLRSRTDSTSSTAAKSNTSLAPVQIRSLILRNVRDRLSADRMDDFLPTSILSSPYLRELTLTNFESLTDTHVHVLLLATTLSQTTAMDGLSSIKISKNKMLPNANAKHNQLTKLKLEDCRQLTSNTLQSISKTCSHEHLQELSLKGCHTITSIWPLSDLLVTKLAVPSNLSLRKSEGKTNEQRSLSADSLFLPPSPGDDSQPGTTKLVGACPPQPAVNQQYPSNRGSLSSSSVASLFAPPGRKHGGSTGLSSLFAAPPPPRHQTTNTMTFLFDPPPAKSTSSSGISSPTETAKISRSSTPLANLFDNPPAIHGSQSTMATLFVPPERPHEASQSPANDTVKERSGTSSDKSPAIQQAVHRRSSSSTLTSLFDLPGTSPTRLKTSESLMILPPPPSVPSFEDDKKRTRINAVPALVSRGAHSHDALPNHNEAPANPIGAVSKRYHRHQRSLSNGTFRFQDNQRATTESDRCGPSCPSSLEEVIIVGSLEVLDLRGTSVQPRDFVDCLWSMTHHYSSMESPRTRLSTKDRWQPSRFGALKKNDGPNSTAYRCWCRVWFKALYLNGLQKDEASSNDNCGNDSTNPPSLELSAAYSTRSECHRYCWTNEDMIALESLLAMDEMERMVSTSSPHEGKGISYFASKNNTRLS
jgi:hypothetical protein